MTAADDHEYACSCLKAALDACGRRQQLLVERYFERFIELLKEHQLNEPLPKALQEQAESIQFHAAYPTDAIPLDLIALAQCLQLNERPLQAETYIQMVIDLINKDQKLFFLRQNVYQEAARYFFEHEKYIEAETLLLEQLEIVKAKGSLILFNFVTINRLINLGSLHSARSQFDEAEECFEKALLIVEACPAQHPEQIAELHKSWKNLEDKSKRFTS